MSDLFSFRNTGYNLRVGSKLTSNTVKTVYYGTESISNLAPKIWEQVPDIIKALKMSAFLSISFLWSPIGPMAHWDSRSYISSS